MPPVARIYRAVSYINKTLIRRMDRAGRLAAVRLASYPIAIDIGHEAAIIIANAAAAPYLRYFEVENTMDGAIALIDFSLVSGGWPRLEDLCVTLMNIQLFLPHQVELPASRYPALQALDLACIPEPLDSLSLFSSLSQLPNLRRLVLWFILFKKCDTPSAIPHLAFRLSHYTYLEKQNVDPDGTASGWHLPIVSPSKSPKELCVLLHDMENLSPVLDQPSCLDAVETLRLFDDSMWSPIEFLPMGAYGGIARLCPRLRALRLFGMPKAVLTALSTQLAQIPVPLRSIFVELDAEPAATRESLAEDDRAFAELLRASPALRHLRSFALLTHWEQQDIPDLQFPAIKAQCRSSGVVFKHDVR